MGAALGMAAPDDVLPDAANPVVKMSFTSVGVERQRERTEDDLRELPPRLTFLATLEVGAPWCFGNGGGSQRQYLHVTDSRGRKLADAEFHVGWLSVRQGRGEGTATVVLSGMADEVSRPDVSWLRLKGTLHVPVALLLKSPVGVLPLHPKANIFIPLSGNGEDWMGGDVAAEQEPPAARLFLKEYKTWEKAGKKMAKAVIEVKMPFDLDKLEIVDEEGKALKAKCRLVSLGGDEFNWSRTESLQFEVPEDFQNLRVRLFYRKAGDVVPVPVDMKLDMGGKIREEE